MSQGDVLRLFHEPRDHDYRQLAARYRKVLKKLEEALVGGGEMTKERRKRLAQYFYKELTVGNGSKSTRICEG